jgi:hypothetical protein
MERRRLIKYLAFFPVVFLTNNWSNAGNGETRDREGRLLQRDRRGLRSDRYGHVTERRVRRGNKVYVYDREGRLLRVERH